MMSKKDNEYWNTFYSKKKLIKKPSSFAVEIVKYLDSDKKLLELGCGNGRDSFFFAKNGIHVIALDLSNQVIDIDRESSEDGNIQFLTKDFTRLNNNEFGSLDYIYSRFTLHSIDKEDYQRTIEWVSNNLIQEKGLFFIEARTINDPLYGVGDPVEDDGFITTHYRRFFRVKDMITELKDLDFNLIHVSENYTDSWYKDDKAVVIRVICEKR